MQKSGQRPAFFSVFSAIFSLFIKVFRKPGWESDRRSGQTPVRLAGLRLSGPKTAHGDFSMGSIAAKFITFFLNRYDLKSKNAMERDGTGKIR